MDKKTLTKIIAAIFLIITATVIVFLILNNKEKEPGKEVDIHAEDNVIFASEYNVDEDNIFIILTEEELLDFIDNGSGILFFGFEECPYCQAIAPVLNEVLIENKVQQAYYFNPKEIRADNSETYKKLVEYLNDYLLEDSDGNKRVYVPDVYLIKNGEILGHHLDAIEGFDPSTNPNLTIEQTEALKQIYLDLINLDKEAAGCEVRC